MPRVIERHHGRRRSDRACIATTARRADAIASAAGGQGSSGTRAAPPAQVHELALMTDLVETVVEHAGTQRVHVVRLVVGRSSGVMADALRFSFEVSIEGTALQHATLEIIETDGAELALREVEVSGCA